jgi:hypothetical protein
MSLEKYPRIMREIVEDSQRSFPDEHLGVADKFLLRLVTRESIFHFKKHSPIANFYSHKFIRFVEMEMERYGYRAVKRDDFD